MDTFSIIILIIVVIGFAIIIWLVSRRKKEPEEDKSILMLQNQMNEVNRTLDHRLGETVKHMQNQAGRSEQIIKDVTERLTKLDETNRQVVGFADQLEKLQDILKNPKQRGIFGEYYLETLLGQVFQPNQYQMQYKFKDGTIVDAALFFADKIIPIDSKFSLENYHRIVEERDQKEREHLEKLFKQDLKNRIDETAKYIRPSEGTIDFAFMFIPAEGIYYDLLVNKVGAIKVNTRDLLDYAIQEKRVHIVSPTTFYVTLQSLIVGMKAFTIQESTKQIIKNVGILGQHLRAYEDYFTRLGVKLGDAVGSYNKASGEFKKIDKDVTRIAGQTIDYEPTKLEKPKEE